MLEKLKFEFHLYEETSKKRQLNEMELNYREFWNTTGRKKPKYKIGSITRTSKILNIFSKGKTNKVSYEV